MYGSGQVSDLNSSSTRLPEIQPKVIRMQWSQYQIIQLRCPYVALLNIIILK